MDISGIGRRIAYWRTRRGLTQPDFGALMDKSMRWVQDVEASKRQADPRISVLEKAAEVLRVPIEALLSDGASVRASECIDAAEVTAIRDVMQRHDVITGRFSDDTEPVDVGTLRRSVSYGWDAFQASHYSGLGRVLPKLIADAQRAAAALSGDAQREALGQLSMAYQLASATLIKFRDPTLAWHAADRGIVAAERSQDPVIIGSACRRLVDSMLHQGQAAAGVELAVAVAERLEPELARPDFAVGLSILGMLYLKAAVAAAELDAAHRVAPLLAEAGQVAEWLGVDGNAEWTAFGPTNVKLHRVSTFVRLGEGAQAVAAARQLRPDAFAALPRERRANTLVELAQGHAMARRRDTAVSTLLEAERLAPQEVRCRPMTCDLVRELVTLSVPAPGWELRGLAQRCGLSA